MIAAKKIYFIGIGGSGMAPMSLWLKSRGKDVCGSDISESVITKNLRANGVSVQIGHKVNEELKNCDLVVFSSAVKEDNEELIFARANGKEIIKRAKMLGIMMAESKNSIAVCGSAGKSSTTGFMASVLNAAKKDASVIVGGVFVGKESGMQIGKDDYFLAEADEYDKSFLEMHDMKLAICTGIEEEHLDIYGNLEGVKNGFVCFFGGLRDDGVAVCNWDSEGVQEIYPLIKSRKVSFGLKDGADFCAKNIRYENGKTIFDVWNRNEFLGNAEIQLIGEHNVLNALSAIVAGLELGIDFKTAAKGANGFGGIKRRIEKTAVVGGITIINDYAHHPTKIAATMSALQKIKTKTGRIIAIFQPHTYSRTKSFAKDFAEALENGSDFVLMTEIYAAREKQIEGISEKSIAKFFKNENSKIVAKENVVKECAKIAKSGDIVVIMSAGDLDEKIEDLISELKNEEN